MKCDSYKEGLDGFVSSESSKEDRQAVAEHLLLCESCRHEHDELRSAATLLANLPAADAPLSVWSNLINELEGRRETGIGSVPKRAWFDLQRGLAITAALAVVSVIAVALYVGQLAESDPSVASGPARPIAGPPVVERAAEDSVLPPSAVENSSIPPVAQDPAPEAAGDGPKPSGGAIGAPRQAWQVETLAGMPVVDDKASAGRIAVGQSLETDSGSKAKIIVADIGSVEIAPNSRVRFVGTGVRQHRLSLDRGELHAKIFAPPRLFIVDTPSAQAVDLGCEYTLRVDRKGNSVLRVTSGFVSLEHRSGSSIVPAGMVSETRKGLRPGTPYSAEADPEFRRVLELFDFGGGGSAAIRLLLARADLSDIVTMWHLLSRAPKADRGAIFDRLASFVKPPREITRDGIIDLDRRMLEAWRVDVENAWFDN